MMEIALKDKDNYLKRLLHKGIKKLGLKFNTGLVLIGLCTSGLKITNLSIKSGYCPPNVGLKTLHGILLPCVKVFFERFLHCLSWSEWTIPQLAATGDKKVDEVP